MASDVVLPDDSGDWYDLSDPDDLARLDEVFAAMEPLPLSAYREMDFEPEDAAA